MAEESAKELDRRIFGSDDDDSDDEPAAPQQANERVKHLLSGASPSRKRKRKLSQSKEEGSPAGDGAVAAAGSGDESDDSDGGGAPEAIEEGGKNDFDKVLARLKGRRGGVQRSRAQLEEEATGLLQKMEAAADADDAACKADVPTPAVAKVAMVSEVARALTKRHMHEIMIDLGMLTALARWLRPMPDGTLVSLQARGWAGANPRSHKPPRAPLPLRRCARRCCSRSRASRSTRRCSAPSGVCVWRRGVSRACCVGSHKGLIGCRADADGRTRVHVARQVERHW